jgi:hypothetical protein
MDITISRFNQSFDKVICNQSIANNLRDHFSFVLPNAKFSPMSKWGWDGTIRLFDVKKRLLPAGLRHDLIQYCIDNEYEIECDNNNSNDINYEDVEKWA